MKFKLPDELDFIRAGRLPQRIHAERAEGKKVLITGATSGVGYETSRHFASMGAQLGIIARNEQKAKQLARELNEDFNVDCRVYIADFEDLKQVSIAADQVARDMQTLDILINNAGAHRTVKKILPNGIDAIYTVNHLASFLLTGKLITLLENAPEPRIINVNSEGHRFGNVRLDDLEWKKRIYTGLRSYGASKSAQMHCMYIWRDQLAKKGITINSMHPGAVKSNIGSHSGRLYNLYLKYIVGPTLKDPKISASAIYYLATSPEMKGISGNFYNLTNQEKPAPHAQESEFSKEIFIHTMKLTGYG